MRNSKKKLGAYKVVEVSYGQLNGEKFDAEIH